MREFDALLLSRARLGIVSVLLTRPEATFSELKELLELTQGNLGIHLTRLEEAGYVRVVKDFHERRPRTTCRLTRKGRRAFVRHVEMLKEIADEGGAGSG